MKADGTAALGAAVRRPKVVERLTPRQREVLGLMAEGLSNAAIGRVLGLPEKTIVRHASNIYTALGLAPSPDDHRRVRAVLRHHGIAPAPGAQARSTGP